MSTKKPPEYGYYLPAQDLLAGDKNLALASREFYRAMGLDSKYAGRYDGVSINQREDGGFRIRVCQQNFFVDYVDVHIHDYTPEEIFRG